MPGSQDELGLVDSELQQAQRQERDELHAALARDQLAGERIVEALTARGSPSSVAQITWRRR